MSNPKISIQYNKFLDPIFIGYIQAQPQWKEWIPPSREVVQSNIKAYRKEWEKYGAKVVAAMQEVTGLAFSRTEIDVHIVSGNPRPFSSPLVLKSTYTAIDFVNMLTHELIHCLFRDNEVALKNRHRFPHENEVVQNHIILHAVLKYIYLDILKEPARLAADIEFTKNSKLGYDVAWKIVEEGDYREFISYLHSKVS